MIVVDASTAVSALLNSGGARELLRREQLHAPHLIDSEIASVIRRRCLAGRITGAAGSGTLHAWRQFGIARHPTTDLLERIWELRDNLSAYDAGYVALAEMLGCALVTADARISRAPGIRCAVTVVPR